MDSPKANAIVCDEKACTACGVCQLMCSLHHTGAMGPASSRITLIDNPFTDDVRSYVCRQCADRPCYEACPMKDEALCLDKASGIAYVNEDKCNGCAFCVDACPNYPPRIRLSAGKNVALKCDLCRGREGGPICVEFCSHDALKLGNGKPGL